MERPDNEVVSRQALRAFLNHRSFSVVEEVALQPSRNHQSDAS